MFRAVRYEYGGMRCVVFFGRSKEHRTNYRFNRSDLMMVKVGDSFHIDFSELKEDNHFVARNITNINLSGYKPSIRVETIVEATPFQLEAIKATC